MRVKPFTEYVRRNALITLESTQHELKFILAPEACKTICELTESLVSFTYIMRSKNKY